MAVIEGGVSGLLAEVGVGASQPQHVTNKPIPHGALGHYRSTARFALIAAQAANSRLWVVRNTGANIIVPTRIFVTWTQIAAHTAAIRLEIDLIRLTGFTVTDATGTVTPGASVRRTAGMAAAPGGAAIRHITIAGLAAGMTGGTSVEDAASAAMIEQWMLLAQPTAGPVPPVARELLDDVNGTHPFALAQNEGLLLKNIVLAGAAAGSSVTVDFSWAEVTAY